VTHVTRRDRNRWLIAGGVAAGVGLLAYLYEKNKTTTSTAPLPPSPAPPPLQPVSGGGASLTVQPGMAAQTVPLEVQDPVVVHLPTAGAQWQSMDGAPLTDKTSPIVFTFLGPISHTFVWFDANNQQQVTTYFFVVNPNPPTPTTNA
jgi:hypothetical protein